MSDAVTLVVLKAKELERMVRGEVTTVRSTGRYFVLPGASEHETVAALKKAGFKERKAPRATRVS